MLAELSIDDLVLIAAARLEFSPGLNVITGETGAGKSLLAQAIGLLMGQKGGDELVRPGAARALVQALFENGDDTLAVARELPRGGRSRARLDGLLSSAAAVEDALRRRLAFYGQLEHTRLLQLERQLDLLDGAVRRRGRAAQGRLQRGLRPRPRAHARARRPARRRPRPRARARHAALPGGRDRGGRRASRARTSASRVERERPRHAGKLLERTGGALALLAGESEAAALDGVRVAQRLVDEAALLDESARAAGGAPRRAHRRARRPRRGAARLPRRPRRRPRPPRRARAALRQAQGADAQVRRLGRRGARLPREARAPAARRSRSSTPTRSRSWPGSTAAQDGAVAAAARLSRGAAAARARGRGAHRGGAARPGHAARDVS